MKVGTYILGIGTLLVVFIGLLNGASVHVSIFGLAFTAQAGALIIGSYIFGFLCTFCMLITRYTTGSTSQKKLTEWAVQDDKLLQQVQSDKEKQLEAKIATLESALQRALKRS